MHPFDQLSVIHAHAARGGDETCDEASYDLYISIQTAVVISHGNAVGPHDEATDVHLSGGPTRVDVCLDNRGKISEYPFERIKALFQPPLESRRRNASARSNGRRPAEQATALDFIF
jgi:hypothetical protein